MKFIIHNSKFIIPSVKPQRGFTLLEMLVAVGLFSVVMLIAVGSLVSIIGANRRAQAQQDVVNSLAFAMENMTRTIRTGTVYHCFDGVTLSNLDTAQGCSEDVGLAFEGQAGNTETTGDQIIFRQTGTTIERSLDGGANFDPITPASVEVERLTFSVDITDQPRVRIIAGGFIEDERGNRSDFNIDTVVSQRAF